MCLYDIVYIPMMQLTVGRMRFNAKKMKGTSDRSFLPIKVPFKKESTHSEVLEKCITRVSTIIVLSISY